MGQHYTTVSGDISHIVNIDPRMYGAYTSYLTQLAATGLQVANHYSGAQVNAGGANWGCIPSLLVTPSATATDESAKYQALIDFMGTASATITIPTGQTSSNKHGIYRSSPKKIPHA